jgi:hypothetical protein
MRGLALVLVLGAGCNEVLGLSSTRAIDAGFYDAQIDAPFACPPTGTTPRFSRLLHQAVVQPVFEYTTSSATMRAVGRDTSGVVEGPIDEVMTKASGLGADLVASPARNSVGGGAIMVQAIPSASPAANSEYHMHRG